MADFIRENRAELEAAIGRVLGRVPASASCDCPLSRTEHTHPAPKLSASEIREWIANDEGLYLWARGEGVRV
jgi:hypothetical protein